MRIKLGDVFEVAFADGSRKFLQYVADDMTQLNSEVVRVFKHRYLAGEDVSVDAIARSEVEFHTHASARVGTKLGVWTRIGNAAIVQPVSPSFRISRDMGIPGITFSQRWSVWCINEPLRYVGALDDTTRQFEEGFVYPPIDVARRMDCGKYHGFEMGG
jgi:hypothetical protein